MKLFTQSEIAKKTAIFLIPVLILTQAVPASFAQGEIMSVPGTEENLPTVPVFQMDSAEKESEKLETDPTSAWLEDKPLTEAEPDEMTQSVEESENSQMKPIGNIDINFTGEMIQQNAVAYLVQYFGFAKDKIKEWVKQGLVKIYFTEPAAVNEWRAGTQVLFE